MAPRIRRNIIPVATPRRTLWFSMRLTAGSMANDKKSETNKIMNNERSEEIMLST
jgi:hypothetical protein